MAESEYNVCINNLREKNKSSYKHYFNEYINSAVFDDIVNELDLNNYSFVIADNRHLSQILDLTCFQMSRLGRSPDKILFDWSITDNIKLYEIMIKHAIKCGRMIAILDENGQIVATNGLYDLCDTPNISHIEMNKFNKNIQHHLEMAAKLKHKYSKMDSIYDKIINKQELKSLYGTYCHFTPGVVRPDCMNKGLMFITLNILILIAVKMGYQCIIGNVTNPSQVRKFKLLQPSKILNIDYGKGYVFNDGTKTDNYFENLRRKYNYNNKSLEKLNKNLIMYMFVIDFNQIKSTLSKQKISISQLNQTFFKNFIISIRKKQKMHNRKSNL